MVERTSWRGCLFAVALAGPLGITHNILARQELTANDGAAISTSNAHGTGPAMSSSSQIPRQPQPDSVEKPAELTRSAPLNEGRSLGPPTSKVSSQTKAPPNPSDIETAASTLSGNEFIRVGGALAVILGLIIIARSIVKRSAKWMDSTARPSGVVEILARYPLGRGGRGQHLILLKVARRIVLLHHNGTSMTALTEMHDSDEVASLLSRLEAGSDNRSAAKFRSTLDQFMSESPAPKGKSASMGGRGALLPHGEAEIIDLTRRKRGFLASMFGSRGELR